MIGFKPGELQPEGRQIDLLNLNGSVAGDGRQQRLQLFELLALGVLLRGRLQDEAEILAQATRNRVIERKIEHRVGGLAFDQRSLE